MPSLIIPKGNAGMGGSSNHNNLLWRIISGVLFVPALVVIAREGGFFFLLLIELGIGIGTFEFYEILAAKGLHPYRCLGILAALVLGWTAYYASYLYTFLTLTTLIFILSVSELVRRQPKDSIYHIASTVFGTFYIGWLMSHLILLRELPKHLGLDYGVGVTFALLPFIIAWGNDTMAFLIGRKFGRHPLLQRVSPNKTWEGTIGGILFATLFTVIYRYLYATYLRLIDAILMGLIGACMALIGDLVESLIKRDASLKESYSTIPGHGGVLDRFDSIFFCAPFVYYYLRLLFEVILK